MTSFDFVTATCGNCHPGGGPLEYDQDSKRYDQRMAEPSNGLTAGGDNGFDDDYFKACWPETGVIEADCLLCHQPEYDCKKRNAQLTNVNFRWAATEGTLGAPIARHSWLPALHLDRIACAICHIPRRYTKAALVQASDVLNGAPRISLDAKHFWNCTLVLGLVALTATLQAAGAMQRTMQIVLGISVFSGALMLLNLWWLSFTIFDAAVFVAAFLLVVQAGRMLTSGRESLGVVR